MSDPNVPPPSYPGPPPAAPPSYPPPAGYQQPYQQPGYQQPGYGAPAGPPMSNPGPAPKPKGNKGCLIALAVVMVLLVGTVVAAYAGLNWLGDKAEEAIGTAGPCPYLSDADASEVMGAGTEATLFTGLGKALNITDARVLPDEPSCILQRSGSTTSGSGGLGRVVKYDGSDAAARYQRELTEAKGVSEDRGGGITVETDAYFNKDVTGVGDEAFCTKASGLAVLSGVLVRQGDTLVYASLVADVEQAPGVDLDDPDNPKLGTDDAACDMAQQLVRKVLG